MTGSDARQPGPACAQIAAGLVTGYAAGELTGTAAWSVEAHLPGCTACRAVLAGTVQRPRLDRNRAMLLTRLALPRAGLAERLATRCGIPPYLWRLLSVTPSLRRSWLAGIGLVLAAAVGSPYLVTGGRRAWLLAAAGNPHHAAGSVFAAAGPYLILAPLLPLAGVAAAFHRRLDPAADLATAAPMSALRLACLRAVAVILAALVPTALAGLALPGSHWLPVLIVAPALGLNLVALALATVVRPAVAVSAASAAWVVIVAAASAARGSAAGAYAGHAQAAWLAVLAAAALILAARRNMLELGWNR